MTAAGRLQSAWLHRGPLALLLWPLSCVYRLLWLLRRVLYAVGVFKRVQLPVPVLVVGNLIVGGAGKTPTTLALVQRLRAKGFAPGIVSRGYGRASGEVLLVTPSTPAREAGDEPLLLHLRTQAPVAVGADRVAAAQALLKVHPEVNLLISDDGLQHWRLRRQAQVIVFDERGRGNGWLLPAGPLREPLPRAVPVRSVVLYNAPAPSTALPGYVVERRLSGVLSLADWWAGDAPRDSSFEALRGRPVLAAAGVAQPERFFTMLRQAGLEVTPLPLPDHHDYSTLPWPPTATDVIVTEKDAVKLRPPLSGATQVWVAPLDFHLGTAFEDELLRWIRPPSAS